MLKKITDWLTNRKIKKSEREEVRKEVEMWKIAGAVAVEKSAYFRFDGDKSNIPSQE